MKTFSQLIALFFLCHIAYAQQNELPSPIPISPSEMPSGIKVDSKAINQSLENMKKQNNLRDPYDNWLNYALEYEQIYNAGGPFYAPMLIFPDSNIIYGTSGGVTYHPLYHAAATILDPYSFLGDPNLTLSSGASYNLDSIMINYAYVRSLPANIVDTLVLSVIKNTSGYEFGVDIYTDTLAWKFVPYDYLINNVPDSGVFQRITYTLNPVNDTTQISASGIYNFKSLSFALNPDSVPAINPKRVIGLSVVFKPGYTYSLANNDSVFGKNAFFLLSSEENGIGTTQTVNPTGDWNESYVATNIDRYYDTIGNLKSYSNQFYPSIGYAAGYEFENHLIFFHITSINNGVKNLSISNEMNFYPNPVNGTANFDYNLSESANQVSFKVFDVTGKEIINMNEGMQAVGFHQFSFNTSDIVSGMYFYSFTVDGQINNGKFIVD